jgi:hypothetical protein
MLYWSRADLLGGDTMDDKVIDFASAKKQAAENKEAAEKIAEEFVAEKLDPRIQEMIKKNADTVFDITESITVHMNAIMDTGQIPMGQMLIPLESMARSIQLMCEAIDGQVPEDQRELHYDLREFLAENITSLMMEFTRHQSKQGIGVYQHDLYLSLAQAMLMLLFEHNVMAANIMIAKEEAAASEVDSTEPAETPEG